MVNIAFGMCTWAEINPLTMANAFALLGSGLFSTCSLTFGTLVAIARDDLVRNIMAQNPTFTHIFMIDADMTNISPQCVKALLDADVPIISPVMTKRVPPYSPIGITDKDLQTIIQTPENKRGPIEVDHTGMACTLIKREVFEHCADIINGTPVWFVSDREPRESFQKEMEAKFKELKQQEWPNDVDVAQQMFLIGLQEGMLAHKGSKLIGEDASFCRQAARHGFKSYVHTAWAIDHVGHCRFNIQDYMDYCAAKEQKDIQIVNRILNQNMTWAMQQMKKEPVIARP